MQELFKQAFVASFKIKQMKSIQFLKKNAMAIVAAVAILGFSSFKLAETNKIESPVTVYFHGLPSSSTDVQNESLWTEEPNNESCNTGDQNACAMIVDESDLASGTPGSRQLDPSKISIQAAATSGTSYVPDPDNSTGSPFSPLNRD